MTTTATRTNHQPQPQSQSQSLQRGGSTDPRANQYAIPFPTGVWLEDEELYFMRNQKQGYNLIFHGYMYKKEASFRATVNWICSNGNGKRVSENKCTARCITKWDGSLKLGKNPHNHPPKFTEDTLPSNLLKADALQTQKKCYDEVVLAAQTQAQAQTQVTAQVQGQSQGQTQIPAQVPGQVHTQAANSANSNANSSPASVANQGPVFIVSKYGTKQLVLKQHTFNRHVSREDVTYWRCSQFAVLRCRARIKTKGNTLTVLNSEHNHEVITKARKYGSLKSSKLEAQQQNAATGGSSIQAGGVNNNSGTMK